MQSEVLSEDIWMVRALITISSFCITEFTAEFLQNTSIYDFTLNEKLSISLIEKKY